MRSHMVASSLHTLRKTPAAATEATAADPHNTNQRDGRQFIRVR
jgi:hypothetical protein